MKKEFQEIVLSARQDDFYRRNMYANFGDIGVAVKVWRRSASGYHWALRVMAFPLAAGLLYQLRCHADAAAVSLAATVCSHTACRSHSSQRLGWYVSSLQCKAAC